MAREVITTTTCDLEHDATAEGARTIQFAFGGVDYELDACDAHAGKFEADIGTWTQHARKAAAARKAAPQAAAGGPSAYATKKARHELNAKVRGWAARRLAETGNEKKYGCGAAGRLRADLIDLYHEETA